MDLLSSYDDESSNTEQVSRSKSSGGALGPLQSEWEIFEKSIEVSSPPKPPERQSFESLSTMVPGQPSESSVTGNSNNSHAAEDSSKLVESISMPDDEEDESHLPPGVRKKNRCHSSSSSSSDDEGAKDKEKNHSDSDMSLSDDSDRSHSPGKKKTDTKEAEPPTLIKEETKKEEQKKTKRGRSSSGSRSQSRSPARRRRSRKSDDRRSSRHSRSRSRSRHSRSRSRNRHHKKDRKYGSRRSRSKERRRSKERDHHHRRRRHSRSRERRGHDRDRRSSRDRGRRSRSRDQRNKSRSPSPHGGKVIKYGDKVIKAGASFGRPPSSKPLTFKEKMRQQLIKAIEEGGDVSQAFTAKDGTVLCTTSAGTQQIPAPKKPPVPLMANLVTGPSGVNPATITAAEAAVQSMLALQKEATEKTGVEIPKYYNPAAINPMKYAEQVQKRKLLWSKTKEKEVNTQWHATSLSSDHDDKSKEKFRKLMGIKQDSGGSGPGEESEKISEELEMKQKELFEKLDKEYQYARMATHTHRGVGLGFGSSSFNQPNL